jgi:hypothetical protein
MVRVGWGIMIKLMIKFLCYTLPVYLHFLVLGGVVPFEVANVWFCLWSIWIVDSFLNSYRKR